jgi:hypothetical protein
MGAEELGRIDAKTGAIEIFKTPTVSTSATLAMQVRSTAMLRKSSVLPIHTMWIGDSAGVVRAPRLCWRHSEIWATLSRPWY